MTVWINRAGVNAVFLDYYLKNSHIYIPWEGFNINLQDLGDIEEFRKLVAKEKSEKTKKGISSLAIQLFAFSELMKKEDYVLIPHKSSQFFALGVINGNYQYDPTDQLKLVHSREIIVLNPTIPKTYFPKHIQHSLGAFRTVFKVNDNTGIIELLKNTYDPSLFEQC